jgi:ABC-type cobalamin transport system ATPase subunit
MSPFQWSTKAQAEEVLALIGPLGAGGSLFVPDYAGPFQPGESGDLKFWHMHLFNGWVSNCGLCHQNIEKYGAENAKAFAKAEMKAEGRWTV